MYICNLELIHVDSCIDTITPIKLLQLVCIEQSPAQSWASYQTLWDLRFAIPVPQRRLRNCENR
jgi:hypothetical protein